MLAPYFISYWQGGQQVAAPVIIVVAKARADTVLTAKVSAMAIRTDFIPPAYPDFFVGMDFKIVFQVDPIVDISGWAITFGIKRYLNDAAPLFTKTTAGGAVTFPNSILGAAQAAISAADTLTANGVGPGEYWWEATRTDGGANTPLGWGRLPLKPRAAQGN